MSGARPPSVERDPHPRDGAARGVAILPDAILRQAFAFARWYQAQVTIVHVEDELLRAARATLNHDSMHAAELERDLRALAAEVQMPGVPVSVRVSAGKPAARILDLAERLKADLIVLGAGDRSAVARLTLGSVAEAVVANARVPVLVVPLQVDSRSIRLVNEYRTVVCASDFSP